MGSSTKTLQYRYDSRGNRAALIDHDGGRFTYSYDAVNRITQVLNPQGDRTSYSYDNAGRRTVKKLANGTRASFTYDAAGNLTGLCNLKSDGAVVSSFDYQYDKVGNRTAVLEAGGSRVTWSYDNAYQLTGEHRTGANAYRDTYTYDSADNRTLKNHDGARTTYAYDTANQLSYSQDAGGRTTLTFDADGNQQVVIEPSGDRTTYAWDYENRMTQALLPSGVRNTMAYDADGLRVKLDESTGTKKFVWDDQNYLGETDAANDTQVVYTNEPLRYGNLISQRRGSTSHWCHFDALGSTRELTDSSAVVSDTRLYDAWGNAIMSSGSTVSPLCWVGNVGYYFDNDAGSFYVRARVYDPMIALWRSIDPLWIPLRVVSHAYVGNGPLLRIDASGLACIVCSALKQYRVNIDATDVHYIGAPHRTLADGAVRFVNSQILQFGLNYPLPIGNTGLHRVRSKTLPHASLDFLFFVSFDICETADPPGGCELFLDETGTETVFTTADGVVTVRLGKNEGHVTRPTLKARKVKPVGQCDSALIFVDFPGGVFVRLAESMSKKVRQKFEVRDSESGAMVWSTNNSLEFAVDLNERYTPNPDYRWQTP